MSTFRATLPSKMKRVKIINPNKKTLGQSDEARLAQSVERQ